MHARAKSNTLQYPKTSRLVQAAPNAVFATSSDDGGIREKETVFRCPLTRTPMSDDDKTEILGEGRFLRLVVRDGWEFAVRRNVSGIVVIVAEHEGRLLLVEQFRPPFQKRVIELPAGLAGDQQAFEAETLEKAARRELLEETGYEAGVCQRCFAGPLSAGMTTEFVTFFRARELTRRTDGGGDESEQIVLHEVPLSDVAGWLDHAAKEDRLIDPKVYLGLYLLGE